MTGWLGARLAQVRGWSSTTEPWTDFAGPWSLALLCALVLPLSLSGPIRAVTGFSLPWSLGLALVLCTAVGVLLWPRLCRTVRGLPTSIRWSVELVVVAVVAVAVWALYIRAFAGFPNLDGWDGGTHVYIKNQFTTNAPSLYNGQVSYYAFAWWLERLVGLDAFRAFALAFYVVVAVTVAVPLAIALSVVRAEAGERRAAFALGVTVASVLGLGVLWLVVLPLLHYNQAAGYYVHLFGLIPLMGLWAADALVRVQVLRVLALLGGFALLRYSYALNLADAALAVGAVLAVEGFRGRWRLAQLFVLGALVYAAVRIVAELRPVFQVWGGMQRFDVDLVRDADLRVSLAGLVYVGLCGLPGARLDFLHTPAGRALRFPLAFALASSLLLPVLRAGKGVQYYYVTKYPMWACILLAFAMVVLVAHALTALAQPAVGRRTLAWLRLLLAAFILAKLPAVYSAAFIHYRTTLAERVLARGPSYKHLKPVADVEALARIKRVLAVEHKHFGGYLTAFYPMFSFMNASFGHHSGTQEFFYPTINPGDCVFWVSREHDLFRLGPAHTIDGLRGAIAAGGGTCDEYTVPWKPTPHSLCYRCY